MKCDFAHPSCSRCQQAKGKEGKEEISYLCSDPVYFLAECSYDGSATQVDLFNLVKLNETVDMLQQRVQSIEADMKEVSNNTQYVADEVRLTRSADKKDVAGERNGPKLVSNMRVSNIVTSGVSSSSASSSSPATTGSQWTLSLTPKGLRIDTNIISLHDLYDILLTGFSQMDLNGPGEQCSKSSRDSDSSSQASSPAASTVDSSVDRATLVRKKTLWKPKQKTFPLYSTWEPHNTQQSENHPEEVYPTLSKDVLDQMMDIYTECLLCLPMTDPARSVRQRYKDGTIDPLLMNAALAWTARHAAIYHDLFPGKDPNLVGEPFFNKAKDLLKERFAVTDVDTMLSLLIMYIYATGRPSEAKHTTESEAYIYLGLAIRMCLSMKMYQESPSKDPLEQENVRRLFWATYFLETLCTIHSDRPFSLPPDDQISVSYPTVLAHEKGEVKWRVAFMGQRFRIASIYRSIMSKATQEKPLLSTVSTLDKHLQTWYDELEPELKYTPGDVHKRVWNTSSFREQACIKLNFEYNFQICQLYGLFSSRVADDPPSAIDLLSRERCRQAADTIVELLECYSRLQQRWCHFSLEVLMVATMVYNNMLTQPDGLVDCARRQLQRMSNILQKSPVHHHKYVMALIRRIQCILAEVQRESDDLDLNDEIADKVPVVEDTGLRIPLKREASDVAVFSAAEKSSDDSRGMNVNMATPTVESQRPTMLEQSMQDMLDVVGSTTSEFDFSSKGPAAEAMQFSDFLYTPTVMDYCVAPPTSSTDGMLEVMTHTTSPLGFAPTQYGYHHQQQVYSPSSPSPNSSFNPQWIANQSVSIRPQPTEVHQQHHHHQRPQSIYNSGYHMKYSSEQGHPYLPVCLQSSHRSDTQRNDSTFGHFG